MDNTRVFEIDERQLAEVAGRLSRIAQNGLPLASVAEVSAILDVLGSLPALPVQQLAMKLEAAA